LTRLLDHISILVPIVLYMICFPLLPFILILIIIHNLHDFFLIHFL